MSSAFRVDGLLIEISKKNRCFANEIALSANGGKTEPKILLMDKAVVTLLISSFCNSKKIFANYFSGFFHYIMMQQEVAALKEQKYHLYLSDDEYRQVIQTLVSLKNSLTTQGRYTDAVDDVLCKVLSAKKRKLKIK